MSDRVSVERDSSETDVAIVGMAGRFPGAPSVDELWRRVVAGDDCLIDLSRDELEGAGVSAHEIDDPGYVRRAGVLDDVEAFDADFFGIGKRDAAIMDPQHRHFIECCWEALETAGHVPELFDGSIGVFAGCGLNTYMLHNLLTNQALVDQVGLFLLRHTANDKDFFTTTVSYRLDLRGPSVNIQTACSTSLVAVHIAVQSLLAFECDIALAGGSTIQVPHRAGYIYHDGEILSPDGHCRAFDERSAGTVLTSGAGVVALRRLADALDDRDPILAVIKGSAVNNDGRRKVGYLAPSVDGHADVVKEALAVAGLSARDLQLLEAHGTGTSVGDPIEVAALTQAFRASTPDLAFCRLVSTKPNIGHLDTAAGIASLIKVVQAMRHHTLPPLANHTAPSPLLDLDRTPFVISGTATPWPGDAPRRAGISSLGVGGTNAHVVVEEAPPEVRTPPAEPEQLLTISATDMASLNETARRLADALETDTEINLADVAHTLCVGRRALPHRRVIAATDTAHAIQVLRLGDRNRSASAHAPNDPQQVAFMLPGGGAHYVGMASGLDERFDVFHHVLRETVTRLGERHDVDLLPLLSRDASPDALRRATASLPAVFAISVALARQWMAWGVMPTAFVGHSLGEYTAAHLAGVLTLDGALDLIAARAQLMDRVSGVGAAMLVVPLPFEAVRDVMASTLSLATINAEDECVIAGPLDDVEILAKRVANDEIEPTLIPLDAAAHSSLLDPILPEFLGAVRRVELSPPQVPYLSNLTGTWISPEQATDPHYWVDHLRQTVRFSECLRTVLSDGPLVLVEIGPGHALSSYARRQETKPVAAIPALRHANQEVDDTAYGLLAAGRAWSVGVDVNLDRFAGSDRRLLRLPGYPFRREHHWIEPGEGFRSSASVPRREAPAAGPARVRRVADITETFWAPAWVERSPSPPAFAPAGPWLVVGEPDDTFVRELVGAIAAHGAEVDVTANPGRGHLSIARSIVLVGPTVDFEGAAERWLTQASAAARSLAQIEAGPTLLAAVTRGATDADGPATAPLDAMALGMVRTAPHEYQDVRTALVDLDPAGEEPAADAATVLSELFSGSDREVAHRGKARLVPILDRVRVGPASEEGTGIRAGGRYLVTGGLGDVGFEIASALASHHRTDLAILTSRPVPEGPARDAWLAVHGLGDATSRRIRRLAELESLGTDVIAVAADLADPDAVRTALTEIELRLGSLDGAVHAAGELRDRPIELTTEDDQEIVLGAKARGAVVLADALEGRGADLLVLVSSTSTVLAPEGQAAYVAANSVLDAMAGDRGPLRVRTINYGLWRDRGAKAIHRARLGLDPGAPLAHPVLAEWAVDRSGDTHFAGTLTTAHHWLVDEHRTTNGTAVLPGTGHLELYLAAAKVADPEATLGSVTLLEPLVVPDGISVAVRVTLRPPDDEGRRWAQLESDGGLEVWRVHSEAQVLPGLSSATEPELIPTRSARAVDIAVLDRPATFMRFGPRWNTVVEAWRDGVEVNGRLQLSEQYRDEVGAWMAHPALVDVATTFGMILGGHGDCLYVPISYEAVTSHGPLPASPWVRARLIGGSSDELLRLDVALGDDEGNLLLAIDGLALRPVASSDNLALPETPRVAPPEPAHRVPPLLAIAEEHGIGAEEGVEMFERFLASGLHRLIASSIELEDLMSIVTPVRLARPPTAAEPAPNDQPSVASTIRGMWIDLLGIPDIGLDDDFFDAGGHSLIAIRLMSRIHRELGVRFELTTIFDAPTISSLAAEVLKARPDLDGELAAATDVQTRRDSTPSHRSLVPISTTGDKRPLFVVHGAGGNVLFLWTLARALGGDRPVYGFQAHGVNGGEMPDPTIEAMASRYVSELRSAHEGPYVLGGYSGGGIVAFEMTRQLRAAGEHVDRLVLFDSPLPGEAVLPRRQELRYFLSNARRHGLGPLMPYAARRLRRALPGSLSPRFGRIEETADAAREIGLVGDDNSGFVDLYYYFTAAAERYEMRRLDVDAVLVKADWIWPARAHDYRWSRYIAGRIDVTSAPGGHWAMFYPENAPRLAEALMPVLDGHSGPGTESST